MYHVDDMSKFSSYNMKVLLDDNTPAEVLRELAIKEKEIFMYWWYNTSPIEEMPPEYENSRNILCEIAKNPNTPPDILKELFDYHPVEVLNNITFSLLILENPLFIEEIYQHSYKKDDIFYMDNIPLFFEEWGVYNNDISIRQSAASKIRSTFLLEICSKDENPRVRARVASNIRTPDYILEKLAFDDNRGVRQAVARNNNAPKNALSLLAHDKDIQVRIKVAENTSTPDEILRLLASSKIKHIKEIVAETQMYKKSSK